MRISAPKLGVLPNLVLNHDSKASANYRLGHFSALATILLIDFGSANQLMNVRVATQASYQIHLKFHHAAVIVLAILSFTIVTVNLLRTQIHFSLHAHSQLLL